MKGVIPSCLGELVKSKFGNEKWEDCLEAAGLSRHTSFLATEDIPDEDVLKVVESACQVLNMSLQQVADAFGDYWLNEYAPKIYRAYYRGSSTAKEFLLQMNYVHETVTKSIPNAHPPRFEYNWTDDRTLVMTYRSKRGLIDFMVGLIKGVGRYFREDLRVVKLGNDKVKVVFPK